MSSILILSNLCMYLLKVEISDSYKSEVTLLKTQLEHERAQIVNLQNISQKEMLQFRKELESDYKNVVAELQKKNHELHLQIVHSSEMLHLQKNECASLEKKLSKILNCQRKLENAETYEALLVIFYYFCRSQNYWFICTIFYNNLLILIINEHRTSLIRNPRDIKHQIQNFKK